MINMETYKGYEISEADGGYVIELEGNRTDDVYPTVELAREEIDRCEGQREEDEIRDGLPTIEEARGAKSFGY